MKALFAAFSVLCATLPFSVAVRGQSQSKAQPKFQIEIHSGEDQRQTYTLKNLTGRTVTACVVELSSSGESHAQSKMEWDSVVLEKAPIEPGMTLSQYLAHAVGQPLPDRVRVIAGAWADGETFGDPTWVDLILKQRALMASQYEAAASLLQQGLNQNWTRDKYLQALNKGQNSLPICAIRSTLAANPQFSEHPEFMSGVFKTMLESFTQKAEQLRKAEPKASVPTGR